MVSKALSECGIFLLSLKPHAKGFTAVTDRKPDLEKLLSPPVADRLKKANVYPIPPESLVADRTLLVRGLDESYGSLGNAELTSLVKEAYPSIEEVIQIPNRTRYIKLLFHNAEAAQKHASSGINIGYQRIPPHQLVRDTVVDVTICYKCYALESHNTRDCKKKTPTCSNCASTEHDFRACKAPMPV